MVARFVRDEEVVGSNPATPTKWPTLETGTSLLRFEQLDSAPTSEPGNMLACSHGEGGRGNRLDKAEYPDCNAWSEGFSARPTGLKQA